MPGRLVATSGGMDPFHVGHLRQLQTASALAGLEGTVVVLLNSDAWLQRKKGYAFMPWAERRELLLGCRFVDTVVAVDDADDTVARGLEQYLPEVFVKGGDRTQLPEAEAQVCKTHGIQVVFGAGGPKAQSSSDLVQRVRDVAA